MDANTEVANTELALPKPKLEKIINWLGPTDYEAESSELNRHLLSRAPGTGTWLYETNSFRQWRDSSHHASLWVKGPPGAGKSVLAASVVENLKHIEGDGTPVLFFFFRQIVAANRYSTRLLRDWLAQLLPHSIPLQHELYPFCDGRLGDISENSLWEWLLKGLVTVPKAFCVADALDEMDTQDSTTFFRRLNDLADFRPREVKVLMTSRARQDLQSSLSAASTVHIDLEEVLVGKEIEAYAQNRLSHIAPLPLAAQRALSSEIAARSRGLFLYANLLLNQIIPELEKGLAYNINAMPVDLEQMYNTLLAKQAQKLKLSTDIQYALLGIITHSSRPVRLRELAGYLNYSFNIGPITQAKQVARFACHPLAQILEDETVQISHHSLTEFLLDEKRLEKPRVDVPQFPILNPRQVHRDIAIACLRTRSAAFGLRKNEDEAPEAVMPFFNYATSNLVYHLSYNESIIDEELFEAIENYCKSQTRPDGQEYWIERIHMRNRIDTPLHVAAEAGLTEYARRLTEKTERLSWSALADDRSGEVLNLGDIPLQLACDAGRVRILPLLWPEGDISIAKKYLGASLIDNAISGSRDGVLGFYFKAGFSLKPRDGGTQTWRLLRKTLRTVSKKCLLHILPHLNETEVDTLACDYASQGRDEMLEAIIPYRPNGTATFRNGQGSALYQVCAADRKTRGHVLCVRMLLPFHDISSRETVDQPCKHGEATRQPQKERTILHALAGSWGDENHDTSAEIFRMLMEAGASLEERDGTGDTAILCLFPKSFNKSVRKPLRCMLEAGADVMVRDKQGAVLIHRALARHVDVELVRILLEHGADVNALWQRDQGRASGHILGLIWDLPFQVSLWGGEEKGREHIEHNNRGELAAFLVDQGATIDAGEPAEILQQALSCCSPDTFSLLLTTWSGKKPIDKVMFSVQYNVQSGYSRSEGDERPALPFIQALITAGVPVDVRNDAGDTPLLAATANRAVYEALVAAGADPNAVDRQGRGILFQALRDVGDYSDPGLSKRLQDLVQTGFDPLVVDNRGVTLLHFMMSLGRREQLICVEQLIGYGISARVKTETGMTPLHFFFDPKKWWGFNTESETLAPLLEALGRAKEGYDINAQDDEGITPLHLAAMSTCGSVIHQMNILMEHGADFQVRAEDGKSVLHLASQARNAAAVAFIIDQAPNLINATDKRGSTPLFYACASGVVESVACLLRAGADPMHTNVDGFTPLHATAEFGEEQRKWKANELPGAKQDTMEVDRYRPYVPRWVEHLGHFADYLQLSDELKYSTRNSYILENPGMAIHAVVELMLSAGADPNSRGGEESLTCGEWAARLGCHGVLSALEEHEANDAYSCFEASRSRLNGLDNTEQAMIVRDPWSFIASLEPADILWLKSQDANFFCGLGMNGNISNRIPFQRTFSFLEAVALAGLTKVMALLGEASKHGESPETTPIDKGTRRMIAENPGLEIPGNKLHGISNVTDHWDLEKIKSLEDYLGSTGWVVRPILLVACQRTAPNLEMLRVLVERCGVAVDAPTTWYPSNAIAKATWREKRQHPTLLHFLASTQLFWHLEAIRYLVSKGADVNGQDESGKTALHHACQGSGVFVGRFVKLLLELGADPRIEDSSSRTSMDMATSPDIIKILQTHGIDVRGYATKQLWLGIGSLDSGLVQAALDAGADVNQVKEDQVYTFDDIEWDINYTGISDDAAALPLEGTLLYRDYLQENRAPHGAESRANVVRLLIDRGADLFAPIPSSTSHTPLLHRIFGAVACEKRDLEVLLEYGSRIDFNTCDEQGRTLFLVACNSRVQFVDMDFFNEEHALTDDVVNRESEEIWDSSVLFIKMLDFGANINATDAEGNNALVCYPHGPISNAV